MFLLIHPFKKRVIKYNVFKNAALKTTLDPFHQKSYFKHQCFCSTDLVAYTMKAFFQALINLEFLLVVYWLLLEFGELDFIETINKMLLSLKSAWLRPHLIFCSEDGRTQLCLWLFRHITIHKKSKMVQFHAGFFALYIEIRQPWKHTQRKESTLTPFLQMVQKIPLT